MHTRSYQVLFDVLVWQDRWTCARCPASDTAGSRHAAEVAAQAHVDAEHAKVRGSW